MLLRQTPHHLDNPEVIPMPFDPRVLLLIVPILAGLIGQHRVRATFARYREVPASAGLTGGEAAGKLLELHGLPDVHLERAKGTLSDHFDSDAKTLRLSDDVADGRTLAALAVAAHEVAHAHQDAAGHRVYRLRMRLGRPVMQLSQWSGLVFIGGVWLGIPALMAAAGLLVVGLAAFALVTLPVELGASRLAVAWLQDAGLATAAETHAVRRVLRAAAFTYLASLGRRLGLLLFLLLAVGVARA
jgi:uncharacterized protein